MSITGAIQLNCQALQILRDLCFTTYIAGISRSDNACVRIEVGLSAAEAKHTQSNLESQIVQLGIWHGTVPALVTTNGILINKRL